MTDRSSLNFANQDLRNRSFQNQDLTAADFRGADLRGCNFRNAVLVGACFDGAKMGQSPRQRALGIGAAAISLLVAGDATSRLIFGVLGKTLNDKTASYIITLYVVLGSTALMLGLRHLWGYHLRRGRLADRAAGMLTGALLGFYYAGILTNKNPQAAIAGAVVGAGLVALVRWFWRGAVPTIAFLSAATALSYGFAFLTGSAAAVFLSSRSVLWGQLLYGLFFGVMSLFSLWVTGRSLRQLVHDLRVGAGTRFQGANLTHASLVGVDQRGMDLTGAIGAETLLRQ